MQSFAIFLIVMIILICLGIPVAFSIAFGAMAMTVAGGLTGIPLSMIAQRMYSGVDSFPLLAVPLFMLAGNLMERGGMSERLVTLISIFFGRIRGGLAMVSVVCCMFFAGISGAATADACAVAGVTLPMMDKKGYPKDFSSAVVATAGTIGPIIPPSIPMVIYGVTCSVSVGKMFISGVVPGILIGAGMIIVCYFMAKKSHLEPDNVKYSKAEIWDAFKESFLTLLAPVFIIVSIVTGVFTPTESASVAVIYSFILGKFVYKELKWSDCKRLVLDAMLSSASVMLIVAVSSYSSYVIARAQLPAKAAAMLQGVTSSPKILILILILFLCFWGMIMDQTPAIMLLAPIFTPLLQAYGIDLVYFGVIMVIILAMGLVTPPVGTVLYVIAGMSREKPLKVAKAAIPFILVMIGVAILAVFVPGIITALPKLMHMG